MKMKGIDIFCASPASTAICLSLEQRSLVRQGSRVLEQSRLLDRQGSRAYEPSHNSRALVDNQAARTSKERRHRRSDAEDRTRDRDQSRPAIEPQKPPRPRQRITNSKSRFGCAVIDLDQSAIVPFKPSTPAGTVINKNKEIAQSSSSNAPSEVVVLRVSLHCQGCAGKVRKHISKMEGVTSFNIDLANKKVTVVGNVTPVGVLESVSRVKNAEFWSS